MDLDLATISILYSIIGTTIGIFLGILLYGWRVNLTKNKVLKRIERKVEETNYYVKAALPPVVAQVNKITKQLGLPDMLNSPLPYDPHYQALIAKFANFVCSSNLKSKRTRKAIMELWTNSMKELFERVDQ